MSDSLAPSPAADLEALDRGVIEAGLIAAQALAEVRALREGIERMAAATGIPLLPPSVPAVRTRAHLSLLPPAG